MDTLFNVTFIETYGEKKKVIDCQHFHEKTSTHYLVDEIGLVENSVLSVVFDAPEGARLYIDGLDQLEEKFVLEDHFGVYIQPSTTPYVLYNPVNNSKPYPFIPGTYFLKVMTPDNRIFEARAKILTKRITEDQHSEMVREIEAIVKGLASEVSTTRSVYNEAALDIFGPEKIDEYTVILSNKEKIINGLHTIEKNRRYSVVKDYPVIPRAKAKKIDGRSLKYLMMHPEQRSTIQAPVSQVTYNIPENRWMKTITMLILKYVKEMRACFTKPYTKAYNQQDAKKLELELTRLHNKLLLFLNAHWIREIPEIGSGRVPMAFFTVGSYNVFYKVYRMLTQGSEQIAAEPNLQFRYKRSDLLYEIWGYLKIIQLFKEDHGYEVKKNWLQMKAHTLDHVIMPGKYDVDYVELMREDCTIRMYYDEAIPNRKEELSKNHTMFTMHNNKPDCRIDVWVKEQYKGSFIVDFKYRKKEYLWNDSDLKEGRPSKVMRQLEAYSGSMRSHTSTLNGVKSRLIDAQPVTEVWAIYPMRWESDEKDYASNDYDIRLIDLSPGTNHEKFSEMLRVAVEGIIGR